LHDGERSGGVRIGPAMLCGPSPSRGAIAVEDGKKSLSLPNNKEVKFLSI